jgi:hypothetical protein
VPVLAGDVREPAPLPVAFGTVDALMPITVGARRLPVAVWERATKVAEDVPVRFGIVLDPSELVRKVGNLTEPVATLDGIERVPAALPVRVGRVTELSA